LLKRGGGSSNFGECRGKGNLSCPGTRALDLPFEVNENFGGSGERLPFLFPQGVSKGDNFNLGLLISARLREC